MNSLVTVSDGYSNSSSSDSEEAKDDKKSEDISYWFNSRSKSKLSDSSKEKK